MFDELGRLGLRLTCAAGCAYGAYHFGFESGYLNQNFFEMLVGGGFGVTSLAYTQALRFTNFRELAHELGMRPLRLLEHDGNEAGIELDELNQQNNNEANQNDVLVAEADIQPVPVIIINQQHRQEIGRQNLRDPNVVILQNPEDILFPDSDEWEEELPTGIASEPTSPTLNRSRSSSTSTLE